MRLLGPVIATGRREGVSERLFFHWECDMRVQTILTISIIVSFGLPPTTDGQLTNDVDKIEAELFRKVKPEEVEHLKTMGGLAIGEYFLTAPALRSFTKSKILADAFRRIDTVAWNKSPFDRKNADLTIRQRMDDYLETAIAFYDGKGKRNDRQKDLTDVELGDRQLSSTIT